MNNNKNLHKTLLSKLVGQDFHRNRRMTELLSCLSLAMTGGNLAEQRIWMMLSNTFCFAKLTEARRYNIPISKSLATLLKNTGLLAPIYQMGKQICKKMRCDLRLLMKPTSDENRYGFPHRVLISSILLFLLWSFKKIISETMNNKITTRIPFYKIPASNLARPMTGVSGYLQFLLLHGTMKQIKLKPASAL